MDFKQLEVFTVLAKELHFARAANHCHMTASAVTRSVQRLECELGCELLIRNNRRVELTQQGRFFEDYAITALQQWEAVKDGIKIQSKEIAGQLKIYSSVTASYGILSDLLSVFRQSYPYVEIQLHTGDQAQSIERVKNGDEEISIAALPSVLPPALVFKTLLFSPLRFIMPVAAGAVTDQIEDLRRLRDGLVNPARVPMIVSEQGLARERLNEWLKKNGEIPNIYAQVSGHEAIVSMVALGFGIGLVPELVIQHSPLQDKIRVIDDAPEMPAFQIGLCALKSRIEQTAVKAFWELADPSIF